MNKYLILFLSFLFFISCKREDSIVRATYEVVPLPQYITYSKTPDRFILNKDTKIVYTKGESKLRQQADFLAEYIKEKIGLSLSVQDTKEASNALGTDYNNTIYLSIDNVNPDENPETYYFNVHKDYIEIKAGSYTGLFYGIQTLRKTLPLVQTKEVEFPAIKIKDYPAYSHRGALLDVSRHFFSVDFIKKYIDVLALCNMNVFHWHLTDDQGWRIEIKKYPKLTELGSKRDSTIVGRHSDTFDKTPYGGFYTQEEIKEVIKYAEDRYITIIPEIDIPGHTLATLASYPTLGCTGGPYHTGCEWGIYEDVLCVGNEETFKFLENVLDEVTQLFPSKYIHIGGDECLKNRWADCPKCQLRAKELGLNSTEDHTLGEQLQSYFIARIEKYINAKGKQIIGWDEILEGGIAPNATIMSWRGTEGGIYAAGKGHDVIMTPESHVYLDYYQSADVDREPFTYGWLTDLKKVYSFDPMPADLDKDKRKHILGAQVNVWTEYMPTDESVEYMLLPRVMALAETVWSNPKKKDYNSFLARLYQLSPYLDQLGYKNSKIAYGVQDSLVVDTTKNELKLYLSTFDNSPIYYSLNGENPMLKSKNTKQYSKGKGLVINDNVKLRASVYRDGVMSSVYQKDFIYHRAVAKVVTLTYPSDAKYTFTGGSLLVDGLKGPVSSYRAGGWLGFSGNDFEAIIDLKEPTKISSVSVNNYVNTKGNLFPPLSVKVSVSQDGKNYESVYQKDYAPISQHILPIIEEKELNFPTVKAHYLKLFFESPKTLPAWHEKRGGKALLMLDEIRVY